MVIVIRDYEPRDAVAITQLFYETVRSVNLDHYSEEQVRAWAPAVPDPEIWHSRMSQRCTLVAEEEGYIIGFAELEGGGYLDMLYCRKDRIRCGVGLALYQAVERRALKARLDCIVTDASMTAIQFFEHCGFSVLRRQAVIRRGIVLPNFRMEKHLARLT